MDITGLYPWQQDFWRKLECIAVENLPHAWLITASRGAGLREFSLQFAKKWLCERHSACNACQPCRWFAAEHPDFISLPVDEKNISIDDIRQLQQDCNQSPHGGKRVILIDRVSTLHRAVANALLKLLEEPPTDCLFILTDHGREGVLDTIASRCFCVSLPEPVLAEQCVNQYTTDLSDTTLAHLQQLQIKPLIIKEWQESGFLLHYGSVLKPFFRPDLLIGTQSIKVFHDHNQESLYLLYSWLVTGVCSYIQQKPNKLFKPLWQFIERFGLHAFWIFVQQLQHRFQECQQVNGVNKALLFESIVIGWSQGIINDRTCKKTTFGRTIANDSR